MRRHARTFVTLLCVAALVAPGGAGADAAVVSNGTVTATIDEDGVRLENEVAFRAWERHALRTTGIGGPGLAAGSPAADFALGFGEVAIDSDAFEVAEVWADRVDRGVRITWRLIAPDMIEVVRAVEAYEGIAGFATMTRVRALIPLALQTYALDRVHADDPSGVSSTIHAFRAGADWRYDEGFDPAGVGDNRTGQWRATAQAGPGEDNVANGQWLTTAVPSGARLSMVLERRNAASSVMAFRDGVAQATVDLSRDIVYWGPFEEAIHTENPLDEPRAGARARTLIPGRTLELENVFTSISPDPDHEAWEYYKYLTRHRLPPYPKAVTFNTNGVDGSVLSPGAKDAVNFERLLTLAEAARGLGVETFILDDGWQARSGDWCPDSPQCPEPRWDGSPDSQFRPRFPDGEFRAVREVLAGDPGDQADDMALGLWWTPMEFHPASAAFQTNPQWSCMPVGTATALPSYVNDGGSFDAGIGVWNPMALGVHPDTGEPMRMSRYMEDRIRRAIDVYGARYFKFDFLVWIDCLGVEPTDMYAYHDEFVAMVDRLQATYPHVTFQIDETNDYRLFPFESVARGPSWFQNGKPRTEQLLHNIWNLAPYVPGFSLGQHAASNDGERAEKGVDAVMAVSLGSHITFWNEIDARMTAEERAQIRRWTDFYKQHRDTIATFTFPLLDDPLESGWTALQPWNPDEQSGWLLVYRQSDEAETAIVPLRGVEDGNTYSLTLHDPADGSMMSLGTKTSTELRAGVGVTITAEHGYALIRIARV